MFHSKEFFRTFLVLAILFMLPGCSPTSPGGSATGDSATLERDTIVALIANPYENVDWATFGRFKTALHVHTTNSDGSATTAQMVEEHYRKGFDILAITDHNYLTPSWDQTRINLERDPPREPVTAERRAEIEAGVGRDGRGMIGIDNTNEQSRVDHVNSFFVNFNNEEGQSLEEVLTIIADLGGISRLNHPGRYTRAFRPIRDDDGNNEDGIAISRDPAQIQKYVDIFMAFPSCVGMEIINKLDHESAADRILWDGILMQTMPQDRPVWGFSDDDSHSPGAVGYAWNVFLMPNLCQENFRTVMETGAFYAVSRVSRLDGINNVLPSGENTPNNGGSRTEFMLSQSTPSIVSIEVSERYGTITIAGANYDAIEWIADGVVIATGGTLSLLEHQESVNSYVRAQLKSATGIAFTQPFGIRMTTPL